MEAQARHLTLKESCQVVHVGVVALDVNHDLVLRVAAAGFAALDVDDVDAAILRA